jgi:hypothetical protein
VENAMLLLHIGYQRVYVNFGSDRLIAADFTMIYVLCFFWQIPWSFVFRAPFHMKPNTLIPQYFCLSIGVQFNSCYIIVPRVVSYMPLNQANTPRKKKQKIKPTLL